MPSRPTPSCDRATPARRGSATTQATRRTAPSRAHRRPARRRSPTASTVRAQPPTAESCVVLGAPTAPPSATARRVVRSTPCTPSRRGADARRRRGSSRATGQPTPRSSARTPRPRPRPTRDGQPAASLVACAHPVRDGLVITPDQLRGTAQRAGQVKRLQDLHHFLRTLQGRPPTRRQQDAAVSSDRSGHDRGEIRSPRAGRSGDRQWGEPMAAYGEIPMAAVHIVRPLCSWPYCQRAANDPLAVALQSTRGHQRIDQVAWYFAPRRCPVRTSFPG